MEYNVAVLIAKEFMEMLIPYCDTIVVAGSIRRMKREVKDIEIVCIPKYETAFSLFGEPVRKQGFIDFVNNHTRVKGDGNGKYCQIIYRSVKIDLFMADKDNYGLIKVLRTGSADYGHRIVTEIKRKGFISEGGYLRNKETMEIIPCPTEEDFYRITGLPYIEPKGRIA